MVQQERYNQLIQRLDRFIRKFYLNQIIRGGLYSLGLIGILFLAITMLEGNFYFDTTTRKILFYGFLGISLIAVSFWVIFPIVKFFNLGSTISHDQAAKIIGNHFSNVKDKLLNLLQLGRQAEISEGQSDLLLAGIEQKATDLQPVPFRNAIDLAENKKYLRYALPPLLALLAIIIVAPSFISQSTERLVQNNKEFERPAPFSFVVVNKKLEAIQYENYTIDVAVEGDVVPSEAYVVINGNNYQLKPNGLGKYMYTFENVSNDIDFKFSSGSVESKSYSLNVLKRPDLADFSVKLDFPKYINRSSEVVENLGDLTIPKGTQVSWTFNSKNTDSLHLRLNNQVFSAKRVDNQLFTFYRGIKSSQSYAVITSNNEVSLADTAQYQLTVIDDRYPRISVEKFVDSNQNKVLYFVGDASDDYGLLNLNLVLERKVGAKPTQKEVKTLQKVNASTTSFEYTLNIDELDLKPGEELSYYFEVFDNDGINGSKSSKTILESYRRKSQEEYNASKEEQTKNIEKSLKESLKASKELKENIKKLRQQLLQQKEMDWQSREELKKLLEEQQELQKKIDEAQKKFEERKEEQQQFEQLSPEEEEKQDKLEEMFEELKDPEVEAMMEKIQDLMDKLNKDQALDVMEKMESNDSQSEKKLDRLEEMFKRLEVEYEVQQNIDKLNELAKKQEELAEKTAQDKEGKKSEELKKEQEDLNKAFEDLKEKMKDVEEKNKELERPLDTGMEEENANDIQKDQQDASEELNQKKNQKASEKQKSASKKMKKMSKEMQSSMQSGQQQQNQEDIAALRQLLENLVSISYQQEELIQNIKGISTTGPRYVEEVQHQFKLKDDFRIVEDTLQALAKRVVQIESFVLDKVSNINTNLEGSLKKLEERKTSKGLDHQQRVMTDVNELALMLAESMQDMQEQMAQSMPGSQSCEKPGGKGQGKGGGKSGSEPSDKMSQGQQSLKEQMERAMENMQKKQQGQKQGNQKGGKSGDGTPSSKEFAEMAAKQAAMRKKLMDKQRQLQQMGKGSRELAEIIQQMNKSEEDLVNKRLTNAMIERQQDILTKLLETEKADRKQKEDEKRESKSAESTPAIRPPALEEYLKQRAAQLDLYKEVSPELLPFYKRLAEEYQDAIQKR